MRKYSIVKSTKRVNQKYFCGGDGTVKTETSVRKKKKELLIANKPTLRQDIKKNKWLYAMCIPAIAFFIIFSYIPMAGLYIAFVNYKPNMGIWLSKFVGLKNFEFFFTSKDWITITSNTLFLNVLFILSSTIASVAIAIMLSEIRSKWVKKITQSIVILPHFMSWTIVALFSVAILGSNGLINQIIVGITGNPDKAIAFYNTPSVWPTVLVCLKVWQGAGFGSIVYLATITGIDQSVYEAAAVDGASRWQCITKITLPLLKNTIIMLTIMSVGKIFYGDFGMIYTMVGNNSLLYPTTDVIDTYLLRSMQENTNMGMTAAIGLVQSVLGFILVIASNAFAKKASPDSALF